MLFFRLFSVLAVVGFFFFNHKTKVKDAPLSFFSSPYLLSKSKINFLKTLFRKYNLLIKKSKKIFIYQQKFLLS